MNRGASAVFVTGATGLLGAGVLRRMLHADPQLHAFVLVRDRARWSAVVPSLDDPARRVTPLRGDVRLSGLGLGAQAHRRLSREVGSVLHFAADTRFSQTLAEARASNVEGTERVLESAEKWGRVERFAYASTAFVAGRSTGTVLETDVGSGWVNAYEQSKAEAEARVRDWGGSWVVFRPSTIVFDAADGVVRQFNAVHRALRLCHHGLAPMLPGTDASMVDLISSDYVCDAVARLALRPEAAGRTIHLCAGSGALPLTELLDRSFAHWSRSAAWRRRGLPQPALTDLATYRLFEESVEETADARLRQVMRSLSHFVPQLAFPKNFDTSTADALLPTPAPTVRSYWERMLTHLEESSWAASVRAAA